MKSVFVATSHISGDLCLNPGDGWGVGRAGSKDGLVCVCVCEADFFQVVSLYGDSGCRLYYVPEEQQNLSICY